MYITKTFTIPLALARTFRIIEVSLNVKDPWHLENRSTGCPLTFFVIICNI